MDLLQETIAKTRYARFLPEYNRREDWGESCWRYINFFAERHPDALTPEVQTELAGAMIDLQAVGSMRALMTAGEALSLNNVAGYNCGYVAVDDPEDFSETMYILMSGTGMGYSVEREDVNKLPPVADLAEECAFSSPCIVFEDSRLGWKEGFHSYLMALWAGYRPTYDLSKLRPKGAILKTFGGRSSGPGPLEKLLKFAARLFEKARGRRLITLECHDLMCTIAEVVVCGGVRRSALICLSNLSDMRIRDCKNGLWGQDADGNPVCSESQRQLSNNSVAYTSKPDIAAFMDEWKALYTSRSGERGIFNRQAAQDQAAKFGGRDPNYAFGGNPCLEIILRPKQFCNLSEVIVRAGDSPFDLAKKVRLAAIFGTLQAALTDFPHLRPEWKTNSEEEALLGVSLTGIEDNELLGGRRNKDWLVEVLEMLRGVVRETNIEWAAKIGINPAKSWCCVKPSGTVSQLANTSSGIHERHAPYYLRRVRNSITDPTTAVIKAAGVPCEPDARDPENTVVFTFPVKSPEGSVREEKLSAIDQLEKWLLFKRHWATHTVSVSVSVKEHEWLDVCAWVYKHFDELIGVSFFPHSEGTDENEVVYPQLPFEAITEDEYEAAQAKMPASIDWASMVESSDMTEGVQTLACVGGNCVL